jgi:hypothetical protein
MQRILLREVRIPPFSVFRAAERRRFLHEDCREDE